MDLKKIIAKLPTGYVDEVNGASPERLKAEVIRAETNIKSVEQERAEDDKLAGAKELVKDLAGPYRDAINAQRAKISYLMHLLGEAGSLPAADVSIDEDE